MLRPAVLLAALFFSGPALACDYPGPPPGATDARATGAGVIWAGFSDATDRYGHGILGDAIEAGGLRAMSADQGPCDLAVLLGLDSVFEDISPRIADIDGDGSNDVVVVETHLAHGASLAVYGIVEGALRKLAATPPIGQTHRWLSPVGIADFNGDGAIDVAYVETPHLGKLLRIWTWRDGGLVEIGRARGLTNHRIGEAFISGGVRDCGRGPEMVTADANWRRIVATRFEQDALVFDDLGPFTGPSGFAAALGC